MRYKPVAIAPFGQRPRKVVALLPGQQFATPEEAIAAGQTTGQVPAGYTVEAWVEATESKWSFKAPR